MVCSQPYIHEMVNCTIHVGKRIRDRYFRVQDLYLSNISEEFVAMQIDLEIPLVISILKELGVYRGQINDEHEMNLELDNRPNLELDSHHRRTI